MEREREERELSSRGNTGPSPPSPAQHRVNNLLGIDKNFLKNTDHNIYHPKAILTSEK
jgi:hypothetical protein